MTTGPAGPQDVVVLAMKAHQVEAVAPKVPKLFGPDTVVVPLQNGIPYWYFPLHPGEFSGMQVKSVDPDGCDRAAHTLRTGDRLRGLPGRRA